MPFEVRDRFFDLVCGGWSVSAAAEEVGVARESAWEWWRDSAPVTLTLLQGRRGGLEPVGPVGPVGHVGPRRRRVLTCADRAVIAACLEQVRKGAAITYEEIGRLVGRDKSVISREIARNSGPDGSYYGATADRAASEKRKRRKEFRLIENPALCRQIEAWMDQGWSPKLIATILRRDYPHMIMERVSHETIYKALYVQTLGSLRKDLHQKLSTKRRSRHPRDGVRRANSPYREAFKIADRPAEHEDRAVPGNWEGDLVLGTGNTSAVRGSSRARHPLHDPAAPTRATRRRQRS